MVAPGARIIDGTLSSEGRSATAALCARAPGVEPRGQGVVAERQHRGGQQRGVDRARLADRQRADRHAGRHLDDRQQAILAGKRLGGDGHAKHRQRREGRGHAGQMRRAAGAGDDHLEARRPRAFGEGDQPVRRAMGGDDLRVEADRQFDQASRRRAASSPSPTGCP